MKANYRKINDHTHNSSTYHKKDGTNVRAKMKQQLQQEVNSQDVPVSEVEKIMTAMEIPDEE